MYVSHAKTENLRGTTSDRRKVEFIVTYEASRWDGRRSILDIPIWSSSELQTRRGENLSSLAFTRFLSLYLSLSPRRTRTFIYFDSALLYKESTSWKGFLYNRIKLIHCKM